MCACVRALACGVGTGRVRGFNRLLLIYCVINQNVEITTAGAVLTWRWRIHKHDIKGSVSFLQGSPPAGIGAATGTADPENRDTITVAASVRHASTKGAQSGSYVAPGPGTATFRFDNTYSLLRMKKVHLEVDVEDDCDWTHGPHSVSPQLDDRYHMSNVCRPGRHLTVLLFWLTVDFNSQLNWRQGEQGRRLVLEPHSHHGRPSTPLGLHRSTVK